MTYCFIMITVVFVYPLFCARLYAMLHGCFLFVYTQVSDSLLPRPDITHASTYQYQNFLEIPRTSEEGAC